MTLSRRKLAEDWVVRRCIEESDGDEAAAYEAAEFLLDELSIEEMEKNARKEELYQTAIEVKEFVGEVLARKKRGEPVPPMTPENQEVYREAQKYMRKRLRRREKDRATMLGLMAFLKESIAESEAETARRMGFSPKEYSLFKSGDWWTQQALLRGVSLSLVESAPDEETKCRLIFGPKPRRHV